MRTIIIGGVAGGMSAATRLRRLDEVAYIRFASVYRRFTDANEFVKAVKDVAGKPAAGGSGDEGASAARNMPRATAGVQSADGG